MTKEKPYRVIIRSDNGLALGKLVAKLVKDFEGNSEIRIGTIHQG